MTFQASTQTHPSKDEAERLAWEREALDEARRDIEAGRSICGAAAEDWLDRWAAGEVPPIPDGARHTSRR